MNDKNTTNTTLESSGDDGFNLDFDTSSSSVLDISSFLSDAHLDSIKSKEQNSFDLNNLPEKKADNPVDTSDLFDTEPKNKLKEESVNEDVLDLNDGEEDKPEIKGSENPIDLGFNEKPTESYYKNVLNKMIQNGVVEKIDAFQTEDGQDIPFDEMDIDEDTFLTILKDHQESIKTKATTDTVSIQGVSDFTKKLIEIEKHGGDVGQALDTYQKVKQPMDSIDISTPEGQKSICYMRLKAQGTLSEEDIADQIYLYEMKGSLEDKSIRFKQELSDAFDKSIENQRQVAIQEEQEYKKTLKNYRTTLGGVLDKHKLSDSHKRKLLDIATKEDESGRFELDSILEGFRKNPIDAAELILFVTDRDAYIKRVSEDLVKEEQKNTLKKVSIIRKTGNSALKEQKIGDEGNLIDPARFSFKYK